MMSTHKCLLSRIILNEDKIKNKLHPGSFHFNEKKSYVALLTKVSQSKLIGLQLLNNNG